jgi:RHS repeat-associated protein
MRTYIACKLYDTNVSITKDTAGRLLTKQQTIGTTVLKATLTRDTLGRVSNILYPSGMNVAITYTADVVSAIAVNGTNLINTIVYRPFSNQPSSWRWGNGTTYTRNFDTDGRITSVTLGTATRSFAYDAVGRISGFSDTGTAGTKASAFTYDEADQLIGYSAPGTTQGFAYDTNGNRLSQTVTGTSATVSYLSGNYSLYSGTNRIASAPNQAVYAYNADGSPTDTLQYLLGYDAYGRLVTVDGNQIGDMVANYKYNGLGQRVVKSVIKPNINTGVNTVTDARQFFYDDSTQLLGEYATKGMPSQETVWFNGQPVATVRAGILYYINADHLATPRSIVRASDNLEVWRWDSDPFGTNNPVLNATVYFPYNLRFPGQYKDTETGLHYNIMRYFDPRTGRYLQADPIGLNGGANRYGYVRANPVSKTDPLGLLDRITYDCRTRTLTGWDDMTREFSVPAVSGPYGNGALPDGVYTGSLLRRNRSNPAMTCPNSEGWSLNMTPQTPNGRDLIEMHPDGNVPGTLGCIGVTCGSDAVVLSSLIQYFSLPGSGTVPIVVTGCSNGRD